MLMGLSNQEGHLVLDHRQQERAAVGYSTLYGDSVGGFAPIKDVPKTLVWELARWRNAEAVRRGEPPPIPENSIAKPPSAELRPGQTDQDSLPPYDVLDAILDDYVERRPGPRRADRRRLRRRRSSTRWSAWSTGPSGSAASSPPGPKISRRGVRPGPPAARSPTGGASSDS